MDYDSFNIMWMDFTQDNSGGRGRNDSDTSDSDDGLDVSEAFDNCEYVKPDGSIRPDGLISFNELMNCSAYLTGD